MFCFFFCNQTEVQFKIQHPKPPDSVCSLPCERGQAKKYVEGESCCWHCFNCTQYQVSNYFLFILFSIKIIFFGRGGWGGKLIMKIEINWVKKDKNSIKLLY